MIQILKNMLIRKKKNGEYTPKIKTILPNEQLTFNDWTIYIHCEAEKYYRISR